MFKTKNFTIHDDGSIEFKNNWDDEEQRLLEELIRDQSEGSELGGDRSGTSDRDPASGTVPKVDPSSGSGDATK